MTHPDVSICDVFASVSGGKDSTAMCLHLKERGIPYRAVFADTGWEHSVTYDYLRELDPVIGPIQWVRAEVPLEGKRLAMAEELEAMLGHLGDGANCAQEGGHARQDLAVVYVRNQGLPA